MKKLFLLFTSLLTFASCSSDEDTVAINNDFVSAEVIYTGEPEVDGCGYMLKIEDERYKPINLPSKYRQNRLKVMLTFKEDPTGYFCGDLPYPQTTIEILEIVKE